MGEVTDVDVIGRRVLLDEGYISYDRLVLAAGSKYNYFGNDHWRPFAPGLKTVADARQIRASVLRGSSRQRSASTRKSKEPSRPP